MMSRVLKNTVCVLIVALCQLFCTASNAQVQFDRKYRVVAYKKGDLSVFSISNEVTVVPAMSLYIPNTFTPNGDGMNDSFGVSGEAVKEFSLLIYNRWGQLLFESKDVNQRWDGTFGGEKAMPGTYIYKVTATGPSGGMQSREGQVNLVM